MYVTIKIDNFARKKNSCSFMKRFFLFWTLCSSFVFLSSCRHTSECRKHLAEVEQVIELYPDSAWKMLQMIDSASIADGEEKAVYNLLMTELKYRYYLPTPNDSVIRYSSDFFADNENPHYQATAYYYHGCVLLELGKRMEAMQMMKKAEESSGKTDDELLRNKIYEKLFHMNVNTSNSLLAMKYARLFLKSSEQLRDTLLICRAYDVISLEFTRYNNKDSVRFYKDKSWQLAEKANIKYAQLLANKAEELINDSLYDDARVLLEEAIRMEQQPEYVKLLGDVYNHKGENEKAFLCYNKVFAFNNIGNNIIAYKALSNLYLRQQNYKESRRMLWMADSLVYAQSEQAQSMPLTMLQQEYDQSIASLAASQRLNRWLAGLLALIVLLAVGIIFYLLKVRKLKSVLSENVQRYNETLLTVNQMESAEKLNQQRISAQESSMAQMSSELTDLNNLVDRQRKRLEQQRKEMAQSLGRGKELFEKAKRGEPFANFQSADEQSFIDYYAFSNSERFARLMMVYGTPTRRLVTFLILCDMGLSDKEIQQVLHISSSTIRSYRYRLK